MLSWGSRRARVEAELGLTCAFPSRARSYLENEGSAMLYVVTPQGEDLRILMLDKASLTLLPTATPASPSDEWNLERDLEALLCIPSGIAAMPAVDCSPPSTSLQTYLARFYTQVVIEPANCNWAERLSPTAMTAQGSYMIPLLGVFESTTSFYLVFPYAARSLHSHLIDARNAEKAPSSVGEKDFADRFLIYQLVRASQEAPALLTGTPEWTDITPTLQLQFLPLHPPCSVEAVDSRSLLERWQVGDVSNLEYILALNRAAGRAMGHRGLHPIVPWVIDFQGNARDLTRSKFRLVKGDAQLDQTFAHTGHHVPENLSDITVAIYLARRLPLPLLRSIVRSSFESKEYPTTIARLYEWSPEECIPEFFLDASIFTSVHDEMPSLDLGPQSPEAFIRHHRAALESDDASRHLHAWIDLNFGVALAGDTAVAHKNVPFRGFVKVFSAPHPQRRVALSAPAPRATREARDGLSDHVQQAYALVAAKFAPASLRKASESLTLSGRRSAAGPSPPLPLSPALGSRQQPRESSFSWLKHHDGGVDDDADAAEASDDLRLWALQPPIYLPLSSVAQPDGDRAKGWGYEALLNPLYPPADAPEGLAAVVVEIFSGCPLFTPQLLQAYRHLTPSTPTAELQLLFPILLSLSPLQQRLVLSLLHPACSRNKFVQNLLEGEVTPVDAVYRTARHPQALFPSIFSDIYESFALQSAERTASLCRLAHKAPASFFGLLEPVLAAALVSVGAWMDIFPTLVAKRGRARSMAQYEGLIVRLYEGCAEESQRLCLLSTSTTGLLWLLWDSWGARFLLDHIVPVLLEWWHTGSVVVRIVCGHVFSQLTSNHMLGPSLVVQNVLPKMLATMSRAKGPSKVSADYWTTPHPPHTATMAVLRVACELSEMTVTTTLLPSLFDLVDAHLSLVQLNPSKSMAEVELEIVVVCRLVRALLDVVRDSTAAMHAVVALVDRIANQVPPLMVWAGVVELVLALSDKIGPQLTKQHLQPALQACVLSMHCPASHLAPFPALESWYLGVGAWPPTQPLPPVEFCNVALAVDTSLPPKLQEMTQGLWQRSLAAPRPKRHSRRWTDGGRSANWEAATAINAHTSALRLLAVLDDDRWLVTASGGGSCKLWRLSDMNSLGQWSVHAPPVTGIASMATLPHHVLLSDRLNVFLYHVPTLQCKWQVTMPVAIPCSPAACGNAVLVVQDALSLHRLHPTTGIPPVVWTAPRCLGSVTAITASVDERHVVLGGATGHLVLMDAITGLVVRSWAAHDGKVTKLQTDERRGIWSLGADRVAHLWDALSWTTTATLTGWPDTVVDLTVVGTADDRLVVASGAKLATISRAELCRGRRVRLEFEALLEKQRDGKVKAPKWAVHALALLTLRRGIVLGNDMGLINIVQPQRSSLQPAP
ncbi:hypothetical protein ACHHYP_03160 [Achlya hypogyna]|uniref:BEACH domain-containing protein n=1 Tax=Achlya hypogyna TaxID=1202772 RepID=A0A1V9Z4G0_ACHHY|nr:hypothetical protein ACHHYP_03160 [Achlya hypogyna]